MVSLIKNQLLKHLSIYMKNLSPDKINFSTLRGEGQLSNLELDENVLTDLLELPSWLRLKSAWCNHVSFRISWTKLKSVPITLELDEVNIVVETCASNTRDPSSSPGLQIQSSQGRYSFIHKVIDGITILVNTVNVKFLSPAFTASVQMARIRVESKTPKWNMADLRYTRLKNPQKGIILIFKELSWQTVRIEASSTQDTSLTPLRLLTNQARCRITIRKRASDCSILASRLVLILDDLLWVLTDSQLKAALHFVDSLAGLIKEATKTTQKNKAQRKLETLPEFQAQKDQSAPGVGQHQYANMTPAQKMFNAFDVRETSYHFFSQRIDLHLCDDEGDGRSMYPELSKGGALQVSVQGFQVDFYPYHLASTDRAHWAKYKESAVSPALWLKDSLKAFQDSVLNLYQPNRSSVQHAPLERSSPIVPPKSSSNSQQSSSGQSTPNSNHSQSSHNGKQYNVTQRSILTDLRKLMSSCVILRIEDFTLYRVTTAGKKAMPKEFVSGDKERYSFPPDLPILHAEFTYFYYPGDFVFPLPPSKAFVHMNPLQIHFDLNSLLWFNSFALNLYESLLKKPSPTPSSASSPSQEPNLMYLDVKLEAIMPRVIIEPSTEVPNQRDRPKSMQIQISRFALTNMREMGSTRADLAQAIHSLQEGTLVFGNGFPSKGGDMCIVTDRILSHIAANDSMESNASKMTRYAMWSEPRDVWCVNLDPVWIDFLGARSLGPHRTIPFIDAVPITVWLYGPDKSEDVEINPFAPKEKHADVHAIAHISNLVSIQIDHFQLLFLLRLAEDMNELSTFLSLDAERILQEQNKKKSLIFGCVVPQVEVTLVMPSQTPESSNWHPQNLDGFRHNTFGSVESPSPITNDGPSSFEMIGGVSGSINIPTNPNTHGYNVQIQSTPTNSIAASQISKGDTGNFSLTNSIKSISKSKTSATDLSLSKEINSGLLSMKKGFSSFMTSIDSAIKSGSNVNDDLMSDTMSIRSDISSDSENISFILNDDKTTDCIDVMFKLNPFTSDPMKNSPVEVGSEMCEEAISFKTNMSSPSEPSETSTWKRKDLVSMVTFRLTTVELLKQNEGYHSSLRLQVAAVSADECGAIPWDELQTDHQQGKTKFGARCKGWNLANYNSEAPPAVRLRLEEVLSPPEKLECIPEKKIIQSWFTNQAVIRVNDVNLSLSMSTVIGLGDLAEDEIITKPLPLDVKLENVRIKLTEDRPPVNITSPGPVPINLAIGSMNLQRDENGILYIQPSDGRADENRRFEQTVSHDRDREILSLQLVMQQIKMDNDNLKKQLVSSKENSESFRQKSKQDQDVLKACLKSAQDDISVLLDEKKALLDTIRSLQTQLTTASNQKNVGNR
ncbi:UHRF1BP1L family protein [Megaselia abdita]